MAEKYRGILPPGAIWYSLNREETIALFRQTGKLEEMTPEEISSIGGMDIPGVKGRIDDIEQTLKDAGLIITTYW